MCEHLCYVSSSPPDQLPSSNVFDFARRVYADPSAAAAAGLGGGGAADIIPG